MKTPTRFHFTLGAGLAFALAGFGCTSVLGDVTFDRSTGGGGSGGGTGGATSSSSAGGGGATSSSTSSSSGGGGATSSSSTSSSSGTGGMATCADTTCNSPATCDDSSGTPKCVCPSGYKDDNGDGSKCTDWDECNGENGGYTCDATQICSNTDGGYECKCPTGTYEFPAGSSICKDDPCDPDPCNGHGACSNLTGTALCSCQAGFIGDQCETCVYFVDGAATGANNGTSWANAFTSIQPAIDAASTQVANGEPTCDVWVKAGTYYIYSSARSDTVNLKSSVGVYGGFAGTETARTQAAPKTNKTIVDGRKNAGSTLRVRHVVSNFNQVGALIDGFVIQGGSADANGAATNEDQCGGGVLLYAYNNHNASLTVSNSEVTENTAENAGGICMIWGTPSITVTGCDIHDNTATTYGAGGMNCVGAVCNVSNTTIRRNRASSAGGMSAGSPLIADGVTFAENVASSGDGGGLLLTGAFGGTTLTNLVFIDNYSGALGGGLRVSSSSDSAAIYNAAFVGNHAPYGGAVSTDTPGAFTCVGCTITANRGVMSADGIQWGGSGQVGPTLTNSIVWGNPSASASNKDVDPPTWAKITATRSDIHGYGGADSTVVDADPMFTSLPAFFDRTTVATSSTTTLMVAQGTLYKVGDVIEIGGDGVAHTVSQIVANTITFSTALASPAGAGTSIRNWGAALGKIDLHLQTGSVCIDAADGTSLMNDVEGTPQKGSARDIGAYESH